MKKISYKSMIILIGVVISIIIIDFVFAQLDEPSPTSRLVLARNAMDDGKYAEAAEHLEAAIPGLNYRISLIEAYQRLYQCYVALGMDERAALAANEYKVLTGEAVEPLEVEKSSATSSPSPLQAITPAPTRATALPSEIPTATPIPATPSPVSPKPVTPVSTIAPIKKSKPKKKCLLSKPYLYVIGMGLIGYGFYAADQRDNKGSNGPDNSPPRILQVVFYDDQGNEYPVNLSAGRVDLFKYSSLPHAWRIEMLVTDDLDTVDTLYVMYESDNNGFIIPGGQEGEWMLGIEPVQWEDGYHGAGSRYMLALRDHRPRTSRSRLSLNNASPNVQTLGIQSPLSKGNWLLSSPLVPYSVATLRQAAFRSPADYGSQGIASYQLGIDVRDSSQAVFGVDFTVSVEQRTNPTRIEWVQIPYELPGGCQDGVVTLRLYLRGTPAPSAPIGLSISGDVGYIWNAPGGYCCPQQQRDIVMDTDAEGYINLFACSQWAGDASLAAVYPAGATPTATATARLRFGGITPTDTPTPTNTPTATWTPTATSTPTPMPPPAKVQNLVCEYDPENRHVVLQWDAVITFSNGVPIPAEVLDEYLGYRALVTYPNGNTVIFEATDWTQVEEICYWLFTLNPRDPPGTYSFAVYAYLKAPIDEQGEPSDPCSVEVS